MTIDHALQVRPDRVEVGRTFTLRLGGCRTGAGFQDQQHVTVRQVVARLGPHFEHAAGAGRMHHVLHLHGFEHRHRRARGDPVALGRIELDQPAGHRRAHGRRSQCR